MDHFTSHEISVGKGLRVTRTRNSRGFAAISITVAGGTNIIFSNENGNHGYEEQARELARMLTEIADDPCILPGEKPGGE